MLAMFKNVELPHNNSRALELLERINTLWDENSWLAGKKHQTQHRRVSYDIQQKLVEVAVNSPDTLEELLDNEVRLDQLVEWVLDGEEAVDI